MELQHVVMGILMCQLLSAERSLACCCSCPPECRQLLSISEANEKECFNFVFTTRIKCCCVREEEPTYDCTEVPPCKREGVPPGQCSACKWTGRKSLKKCKCGVLDSCCAFRVAELNCNICLDLRKCLDGFGKVLPCDWLVSEERYSSSQSGSHIDAKACLRCCVCMQRQTHELGPNCTDQFCCETAPLSKIDCGVLDFCCTSRVKELNGNICLDLKKCFDVLGKVLPCVLKCDGEECCLSLESGSSIDAKACLPCCVCVQKHMHELRPNCTYRFCYKTALLGRFGCGVLDSCCAYGVTELNCNISLDLKKYVGDFVKVLPCVWKCVTEDCCLSEDSGCHVHAKDCPPCCVCVQKHMYELEPNSTDRFSFEAAPLNRNMRTKENLQAILASLGLVLLLL